MVTVQELQTDRVLPCSIFPITKMGLKVLPKLSKLSFALFPNRCCTGQASATQTDWLWTGWAATCTGATKAVTPSKCPSSMGPIGLCWSALASGSPGRW